MNILIGIATEQNIIEPKMGSERQMLGYANALARIGHTVHVANILKDIPDWSINYDVCHLINASGLKGPYMSTATIARMKGIPVLISPVYWPTHEVQKEILKMDLSSDEASLTAQFQAHLDGVEKMMHYADWLLPNSEIEMKKLAELMGGKVTSFATNGDIGYTIIYNGIDVENEINLALTLGDFSFDPRFEKMLHDRFILCVGRIEPRKNQVNLMKAIDILCEEDDDLQLVLMGDKSAPYIKKIKEEKVGRNVLYCPPGPPSAVLKMARRCTAHALISFIETPGLVNLEAAAMNKPIVVGDRGSVREYFLNLPGVFYCDPTNPEDIAKKIRLAMDFGPANELGEFVRERYSYDKIGLELERTYKRIIALHKL